MWKPRQARRLPALSALIAGSALALAIPALATTASAATEFNTSCNLVTGKGCVLPPKGPGHFFPFFTLAKVSGRCVWEFGNMNNGRSFGGDKQYGKVGPGTMGAFAGRVRSQPSC